MLSKRFALIVGGTIGGLGAVVSITPPQFGSSGGLAPNGTPAAPAAVTSSSPAQSSTAPATTPATPAPAASSPAATTPSATTKKKKSKKSTKSSAGNSASATSSANATAANSAPANTPATTAPTQSSATTSPAQTTKSAGASGTFTGDVAQTRFGPVQVKITVSNGRITNVTAPQYPTESFRDQQINAQAIPWLEQETIQAQSANIQGVGGASYTSEGFYQSLVSALSKAGM